MGRQRARDEERRYFRFGRRLASGEIPDVEVYAWPMCLDGVRRPLGALNIDDPVPTPPTLEPP